MKRISVREFQLHAKLYLSQLPIVLTQYNIAVAEVTQVLTDQEGSVNIKEDMIEKSVSRSVTEIQEIQIAKPKVDTCYPPYGACKGKGILQTYYVFDEEGRHERTSFLCPTHLAMARKEESKHL